jgi:hypothetical protein
VTAQDLATPSVPFTLIDRASDVDIVVKVTDEELADIRRDAGVQATGYDGVPRIDLSVRRGRLNFILVTTDKQLALWREGTRRLMEAASASPDGFVSREVAVATFNQLEEEMLQ